MKMIRLKRLAALACMATLMLASSALLVAHDMLTDGTVLSVADAKLEITAVNKSTKKEETVAFVIDDKTKVKRGTETVSYSAGNLKKGERVTVVVNTDAPVKMLATEIRVAAK